MYKNEINLQKKWIIEEFLLITKTKIINISIFRSIVALLIPKYGAIYFYRKSRIHRLKNNRKRSYFYKIINHYLNNIDISSEATLEDGVKFPHPQAVIIGGNSIIGKNTIIFSCVTIGTDSTKSPYYYPTIGRDCYIGTGSKIIGGISIGDNSITGANSVVTKTFPPHSKLLGIPAKNINK